MISLQGKTCILLATLVAVSLGQDTDTDTDNSRDACKGAPRRKFSLADIEESIQTGSVPEAGPKDLPQESSNWCSNNANIMFRTNDGTCNHPNNLGAAGKPIARLRPPEYDDGFGTPRQRGKDGRPLPSARLVSLTVHPANDFFSGFPIMMMQWGQWTAHDCVATATSSGDNRCCGANGGCPPFVHNPRCFPIEIPPNDPTFTGTCLDFVRSLAANDSDNCAKGQRTQINAVTSHLDCSQIYGSSNEVAASVREAGGFLLRTKNGFPPEGPGPCTKRNGTNDYCFLAGDARANQHAYLGAMHTLWIREHNYIATKLREVIKNATHEYIFQFAKKLIIAITQAFTYNVYLRIVLGEEADRWGLTSKFGRSKYNPGLNPTVLHEFSTACFRYGHSTIPTRFPVGNESMPLRFMFTRPHIAVQHFDSIMAGMVGRFPGDRGIHSSDRSFSEEVSRALFFNNITKRGFDLVTSNIHRERDHGLAPYWKWRSFCGLRPLTGFNDTEALGPFANELAKIYNSIHDIDFYTGILHEPVLKGLVGPTIACIVGIQFHAFKHGDRFFFDNTEPNSGFTDAQLANIRKVTMSQIICRHSPLLTSIQVDAFRFRSSSNPDVSCSTLKNQGLNFNLFAV